MTTDDTTAADKTYTQQIKLKSAMLLSSNTADVKQLN